MGNPVLGQDGGTRIRAQPYNSFTRTFDQPQRNLDHRGHFVERTTYGHRKYARDCGDDHIGRCMKAARQPISAGFHECLTHEWIRKLRRIELKSPFLRSSIFYWIGIVQSTIFRALTSAAGKRLFRALRYWRPKLHPRERVGDLPRSLSDTYRIDVIAFRIHSNSGASGQMEFSLFAGINPQVEDN